MTTSQGLFFVFGVMIGWITIDVIRIKRMLGTELKAIRGKINASDLDQRFYTQAKKAIVDALSGPTVEKLLEPVAITKTCDECEGTGEVTEVMDSPLMKAVGKLLKGARR